MFVKLKSCEKKMKICIVYSLIDDRSRSLASMVIKISKSAKRGTIVVHRTVEMLVRPESGASIVPKQSACFHLLARLRCRCSCRGRRCRRGGCRFSSCSCCRLSGWDRRCWFSGGNSSCAGKVWGGTRRMLMNPVRRLIEMFVLSKNQFKVQYLCPGNKLWYYECNWKYNFVKSYICLCLHVDERSEEWKTIREESTLLMLKIGKLPIIYSTS